MAHSAYCLIFVRQKVFVGQFITERLWHPRSPGLNCYGYCLWAGSSLIIATGRCGGGILLGARLFTPFQTGPGAYLASCVMGTWSLPGKAAGAWH
jgi:hypothetical protein